MVGGAVIGYAIGRLARAARVLTAVRPGNLPGVTGVTGSVTRAFDITWDYRCPFARNAHEHVIDRPGGRS